MIDMSDKEVRENNNKLYIKSKLDKIEHSNLMRAVGCQLLLEGYTRNAIVLAIHRAKELVIDGEISYPQYEKDLYNVIKRELEG